MSVHIIYYKDGRKMMRAIQSREEYMKLRHSTRQQKIMKAVHEGDEELKRKLVQMNYSCLPNDDGSLKGSTRMSTTIGMDVDHIPTGEMEATKQRILEKKDELGLLMLEVSARGEGYHLVFRRREELTQEENLKWASDLLGVKYDEGAKDITRVFYTTTGEELVFLEDDIFKAQASPDPSKGRGEEKPQTSEESVAALQCCSSKYGDNAEYNGMLFKDIIAKYWELFNDGKEPVEGDRNALTFELAVTLRSICGFSLERLMEVIPNYWKASPQPSPKGKGENCSAEELAEWKKTLENALKEPHKGMPYRLKQVLGALKSQQGVKACGGTQTVPPEMPKRLPPLIRLLTKNVPDFYKPAVANAVFPALGVHLHGVKFRYWDNVDHEATFVSVTYPTVSVRQSGNRRTPEHVRRKTRDQRISAYRC